MTTAKRKHGPSLRHHKPTGQAFVELNGHRYYLGKWGLPETEQAYHRKLNEWLENGRTIVTKSKDITITELTIAYWRYAQTYYVRPDGRPTSMQGRFKSILKSVRSVYGATRAVDFGPNALRAMRQKWIEDGLARKTVNDYAGDLRAVFKWAASHEMIPSATYQALLTVDGLRAGRSEARETPGVKPVSDPHIEAIKPHVSRQVAALIELQLLTGARPGELVKLRPFDFDTRREVWTATISDHKTSYRGKQRVLYFGPRAQAIVREFMVDRAVDAYLFSPREAETERGAKAPTHRRPDQEPTPRKTNRTLGDVYTVAAYRRAIARACKEAAKADYKKRYGSLEGFGDAWNNKKTRILSWHPHQLRHNAATTIRREYGLEAAQLLLGHAHADVTQIYAERDASKALKIAKRIG